MRATFLCFVALPIVLPIEAAPAPDRDRLLKQKLEALKKRLPDLVSDWLKKGGKTPDWLPEVCTCNSEVRLLRRVGSDRAKLVILFEAFNDTGTRLRHWDVLLTVFLSFQDGCWTTERFEAARRGEKATLGQCFAFLMLAIDEAAVR